MTHTYTQRMQTYENESGPMMQWSIVRMWQKKQWKGREQTSQMSIWRRWSTACCALQAAICSIVCKLHTALRLLPSYQSCPQLDKLWCLWGACWISHWQSWQFIVALLLAGRTFILCDAHSYGLKQGTCNQVIHANSGISGKLIKIYFQGETFHFFPQICSLIRMC